MINVELGYTSEFIISAQVSPLAEEAQGIRGETLLGFAAQRLRTVFAVLCNTHSRVDCLNLTLL